MKPFYSRPARATGVVMPWLTAACVVLFAGQAVVDLYRLDLGWFIFWTGLAAVQTRNVIAMRRNHRTLKALDADIAATQARIAELEDPEW